jgi:hypothetical protein
MYQDNHLTSGTAYSLRNWLYLNDWHNAVIAGTGHPEILTAALSPYEPPAIVAAIATNLTKAPYEYNSHRLGAGTDDTYQDTDFYHLSTPAYVRRDTQWTPQFVIGSMTYDSTKTYTADSSENQFSGVIFNSAVTNRLIVQGIGTAKTGTADSHGVTSASNKQTLVAALGKDAKNNAGTRVFVSNTLYNNLVTNGNWLLTQTMHGYAGIRIATGGFSWVTTNNDGTVCTDGKYLNLSDKWSPLVIQCGRADDYATNFNNFSNAVLTTTYFNWDSVNAVMTYTNLMGQQFKMWRDSDNLPWVGGGPREQSPTYLYQSPYLSASPYSGPATTVTISYPGFADLVLNFDYSQ